jgi:hypothetical protein
VSYRTGPILWGLVLIGFGALFLAQELSDGAFNAGEFIGRWWPLLLVLLGIWLIVVAFIERRSWSGGGTWTGRGFAWGPGPSGGPSSAAAGAGDQVSIDLEGASQAEVQVAFGAGQLAIRRGPSGKLVEGTFDGGVRPERRGPGRVRLGRAVPQRWGWGPGRWGQGWHFGVTGEVPLALSVETGASDNDLDLGDLRVTNLRVQTGASRTRISLPRAAGFTRGRVDAGAATVRIEVPDGVAVRLIGRMQLGTNDIDTRRFPASPDGWASPDYDAAPNRVELTVTGGLATLQVLQAEVA